jgi:hypothetical protein
VILIFTDRFFIDQKTKTIIPKTGFNEEWDDINQKIENLVNQFHTHLTTIKKKLG